MSPCDCKKEKCKSKAVLFGTFKKSKTGKGFTYTMSATGRGSTNCLAQDEAQKNVEETLIQYLGKNPSVILIDYYIEYTNKCNGKVITEPCFRPDDKYTVTFKVHKKITAAAVTLPDFSEQGFGVIVNQSAEIYLNQDLTGEVIALVNQSHFLNVPEKQPFFSQAYPSAYSNTVLYDKTSLIPAEITALNTHQRFAGNVRIDYSTAQGKTDIRPIDYSHTNTDSAVTYSGVQIQSPDLVIGPFVYQNTFGNEVTKVVFKPESNSSNVKQGVETIYETTGSFTASPDQVVCLKYTTGKTICGGV